MEQYNMGTQIILLKIFSASFIWSKSKSTTTNRPIFSLRGENLILTSVSDNLTINHCAKTIILISKHSQLWLLVVDHRRFTKITEHSAQKVSSAMRLKFESIFGNNSLLTFLAFLSTCNKTLQWVMHVWWCSYPRNLYLWGMLGENSLTTCDQIPWDLIIRCKRGPKIIVRLCINYLFTTKLRVLWEPLTRQMASCLKPVREKLLILMSSSPACSLAVAALLPSSTCDRHNTLRLNQNCPFRDHASPTNE